MMKRVVLTATVFLSMDAEASRIDYSATHERASTEAFEPAVCPSGVPAGSVCQIRTVFKSDLQRIFGDRLDEPDRELVWVVLRQLCVDGTCSGELFWDMGSAGRHDARLSDKRGYKTKRLYGMKGSYVFRYRPSSPAVDKVPGVTDEVVPPCITRKYVRITGWSSEGVGRIILRPTGGKRLHVVGPGEQDYTHKERHTTRINGCSD